MREKEVEKDKSLAETPSNIYRSRNYAAAGAFEFREDDRVY